MRSGYGPRLRDAVQRVDSVAGPIAEVVVLEDSHVKNTRDEWTAGARTNVSVLSGGGVSLTPSSTTRIAHTAATDPTDITRLTTGTPFDGIWIEWSGEGAQFRELRNFVARLHPRLDAGQPKEAALWVFQAYRVAVLNDDEVRVELITQREMAAAGDVAADVTFNLTGYNNSYPRVGAGPTGTLRANPITVIRIVALKADGTVASNVSWEGSSTGGDDQSGTGYDVYHRTFNDLPGTSGGTNWFFQEDRSDLPRFTLNEATYADGDVEFTSAAAVPDLTGSGDVSVVLRGSEPSDSLIRAFIWNGAAYVRCYDGDVLGQDNTVTVGGETFGGDLSGVPTTGPWNIRVYLDASSDGLNAPTVRDFGLEKKAATSLVGAAEVNGGGQRIADLTALKASIANIDVAIAKSGEKDFDDYGSRILATNHTGQIEIRIYVGDMTGTELARSEWMLHSTWEVETYHNRTSVHQIRCLSPLRRLRKLIPPFVTVGEGPGGTRTAVELAETIEEAWLEILDALAELPGRYIGSGPTSTDEIADTIRKADAKDTLDSISYLDGGANIESQGRIKHVRIMHDDPADEAPVFRLPIGSYEPLDIGPGFDARTDEFFVPYNWSQAAETYEDERRHVNLAALENLGGTGLNTTQELRDEVARWIRTETLADKVGRRVPKHFGTGELVWHVRSMEAMPHLEIGDVGIIETDLFVAKTPINGRELRGPLATLCIVVGTDDVMGTGLWLWVPSYELMTVIEGGATRSGFVTPEVRGLTVVYNEDGDAFARILTENAGSVRVLDDATAFPDPSSETAANVDADGWVEVALSTGYLVGEDAYISVVAYELVGGGGRASSRAVAKATRPDPGELIAVEMGAQAERFATNIVFSASDDDTVAWTSGTVTLALGDSYSIDAGNTGNMSGLTFIYLDIDTSETVLQVTTTFGDAVGLNKILMCTARPASAGLQFAFFVPAVGVFGINADQIGPNSVTSTQVADGAVTEAKIGTSAVTVSKLADGTVTQVKMGSGLRVPAIVASLPSLPNAAYPQGALVVLTSDNKLYRSTGSAWTAAVPASDLSGSIDLATQVAGELTAAFAAAGLINANVTINADGSLSGAGGGQASLASLPGAVGTSGIADEAVIAAKLANYAVGSRALDGTARSQHGVFMETFETDPGWTLISGGGTGAIVSGVGVAGGNVYQATGQRWIVFPQNIPYDPSKLYRMRVRVRRTATVDGPNDRFYAGFEGVGADGTTRVNTAGADSSSSQHYFVASGVDAGLWPLNEWREYTNWVSGQATPPQTSGASVTNPAEMHADVRYFRPMLILNYQNGTGNVMQVDYVVVDVFDEDGLVRSYLGLNVDGVVAADRVVSDSVLANAITTAKIAAGAVEADQIAANAVTTAKLNALAVTAAKIAASAIETDKLAANAVTAAKIAADTIVAGNIAAGAIGASEIAAAAVIAGKIAAGAVDTDELAANAVTAAKIAAGTITATQIASNAVTADKIQANAVTAGKIDVASLSAISADLGTVTAGTINTGVLVATESFTATNPVFDGTVTVEAGEGVAQHEFRGSGGSPSRGATYRLHNSAGSIAGEVWIFGSDMFIRSVLGDLTLRSASGEIITEDNLVPDTDSARDIGTAAVRFANIYGDIVNGGAIHVGQGAAGSPPSNTGRLYTANGGTQLWFLNPSGTATQIV